MAKKAAAKKVAEAAKVFIDPDAKLAYHLENAEAHLIAAAELFLREQKPDRHHDFVSRLTRAQELVTWLYREELIRIRGPIKLTASIGKRK
jgi:hypothetical protein